MQYLGPLKPVGLDSPDMFGSIPLDGNPLARQLRYINACLATDRENTPFRLPDASEVHKTFASLGQPKEFPLIRENSPLPDLVIACENLLQTAVVDENHSNHSSHPYVLHSNAYYGGFELPEVGECYVNTHINPTNKLQAVHVMYMLLKSIKVIIRTQSILTYENPVYLGMDHGVPLSQMPTDVLHTRVQALFPNFTHEGPVYGFDYIYKNKGVGAMRLYADLRKRNWEKTLYNNLIYPITCLCDDSESSVRPKMFPPIDTGDLGSFWL